MLIINKEQVGNLLRRLNDPSQLSQCQDEVGKMLEIESDLQWWAQSGKCCRWQAGTYFEGKIQLLKEALNALGEGDTTQASTLLWEYTSELDEKSERTMQF